jgi:hypothetical protein
MELMVLVEPLEADRFRATVAGLPLMAEGKTQGESLRNLRAVIEAKLRAGAKLTTMRIGTDINRVLELSGTLDPNDPVVKEWMEIMAERRRQEDSMQEAS